jgi:hypothetical protein
MRNVRRSVWIVSLLLTFAAAAQNSGPASNGDFQFGLSGASGAIQYNARMHGTSAQGQMTFTGTMDISNEDVDGEGSTVTALTNVTLTVNIDCLRIEGNRAAMSGLIASSSYAPYIGARALLAVEDNGEGSKAPALDRFTWGVYRNTAPTWTPSDAEVPGDNGAMFTWYASDFERPDDVPVLSTKNFTVDCKTFPFGAYGFEDAPHGSGNIQVKP